MAITRAKDFLTISYAQNRYRFGQIRVSEPSRFIEEINTEHYEFLGGFNTARQSQQSSQVSEPRASISGNFANPRMRMMQKTAAAPAVDSSNFKASPVEAIIPGATVLHLKFGEGKIISVEGPKDNRVAAIQFKNDEMPERRIVLKFAKLQVL